MIRSSNYRRRPACVRDRGGFTMVEILMVVVIISILLALLLPAINAAMRTARNAAASAEINQLATAVENFRSKYGDYPPSRVYLAENGLYPVGLQTQVNSGDPNDIQVGQLAQRSLIALRKFFPRVTFGTQAVPPVILNSNGTYWYDFNGNGVMDNPYILQGHECLAFFLGGIPLGDPQTGTYAMTGFGKDPTNPFYNSISGNAMYSGNRQPPIFEFNTSRLFADPNRSDPVANPLDLYRQIYVPGYYDSLGNSPPALGGNTLNFYAYFSGYGSGTYDADDVNFPTEADGSGISPIGLQFQHAGSFYTSPAPNPYTTTTSISPSTGTVTFQKAQSFQIIAAGVDGLYGVGGQFIPPAAGTSTASNALPLDAANTYSGTKVTADATIRIRERDNLTNFKSGTLQ
ncbi:MAG: type II secretion system protein [Isosphaerales bacterium]